MGRTRQSQMRRTKPGQQRKEEDWDGNKQDNNGNSLRNSDDSCECKLCHTNMMKKQWGDRGCGCELCQAAYEMAGVGAKCKMLDDFIDTRGFAMRRGHRGRVVHHCRAEPALPGRCSFKRRAGGHRDVYRCGMCKPGRHHGPGGAKSLKNASSSACVEWAAPNVISLE